MEIHERSNLSSFEEEIYKADDSIQKKNKKMKKEKEETCILNITPISFLCKIFSEHLLCTKHCIRGPATEINKIRSLPLRFLWSLLESKS